MKLLNKRFCTTVFLGLLFSCGSSGIKADNTPNAQSQQQETEILNNADQEIEELDSTLATSDPNLFYLEHAKPILDRACATCHASGTFLDLSSFPFTQGANDQVYILSRIVARINDTQAPMPPVRKGLLPLNNQEKEILSQFEGLVDDQVM